MIEIFRYLPIHENMAWKNPFTLLKIARSLGLAPQPPRAAITERRKFTRVPIAIDVDLFADRGVRLSGRTKDVSMKGVYFVCDQHVPVGTECQIAFLLGGRHPHALVLPVHLCLKANGRIVRVSDSGMGIELTEIVGKDSFEYLRCLLLHHAVEATRIAEEIRATAWSYETHLVHPCPPLDLPPITQVLVKRTSRA